jgi:hypothetical protein
MYRANSLLSNTKNKINATLFQSTHRIGENSFTRERKLTFPMVFSTILKLVKKSLAIECKWLEPCESKVPPSKQALSKARYKMGSFENSRGIVSITNIGIK